MFIPRVSTCCKCLLVGLGVHWVNYGCTFLIGRKSANQKNAKQCFWWKTDHNQHTYCSNMSEQLAFSRSVTSKPRGPRGKNPKWTSIHPTMSGLAQLSAWKAQNDFSNKWFVRTTNTLKVGYSELLCCKLNRACKAQLKIEVFDDAWWLSTTMTTKQCTPKHCTAIQAHAFTH